MKAGWSMRETVARTREDDTKLREVVYAALNEARRAKDEYNAFISLVDGQALDERLSELAALSAEEKTARTLFGVPLAVKDNICWKGLPTTCASRLLDGFQTSYTATVVERLENAGAVVIGKTNLDEFAFGSSNETSDWGAVKNPHDPERVPGGSSGGSAVAAALGVPLTLGSDTGGSVRQPAAFCGVYGLKPTYGRLSRYGLVSFASSMDQIGLFARDPWLLRMALEAASGVDERDATTREREADPLGFKTGMNIGWLEEFSGEKGVQPAVAAGMEELLSVFEDAGCRIMQVSIPEIRHSTAVYMLTAIAEASSNLSRFDGINYGVRRREMGGDAVLGDGADRLQRSYAATRGLGFGDEVKRRIMLGTFALAEGYYDAYYLRAQKVRTLIRREFERAFDEVDLIACPTTPTTAFRLGEKLADPIAMYLADMFTNPANLAGLPALSIPWGTDEAGLPIGMQLIGPRFSEERLLEAAAAVERKD